jgi:hypothetical protein
MKAQLDMVLDIVDPFDEYKFILKNERCHLPSANLYPDKDVESKPGSTLIVVKGNKPAMIRYALITLIQHERAHHRFIEEYPDFVGDHHDSPDFQRIERELLGELDQLIFKEHDAKEP